MRLHRRTMLVEAAHAELMGLLLNVARDCDLTYPQEVIAVATCQANTARIVAGLPVQPATMPGYAEVAAAVTTVMQQFGLTEVEMIGLLARHLQHIAKFMLRQERHPGDPDARADEADD